MVQFKSPDEKVYTCVLHGIHLRSRWEWYGFEQTDEDTYFGYVQGFENEFGYFSLKELKDNKVSIISNPKPGDVLPPIGWKQV